MVIFQRKYHNMKGVVFTEFLELVEDKFGYEVVDFVIESSNLSSNGSYTAIGTYPHQEIHKMLDILSKRVDVSKSELLQTFGKYLTNRFSNSYTEFYEKESNTIDFLNSVEDHIHVEVKKLYPDAELPTFDSEIINANKLVMIYKSKRKLSHLAEGLIYGAAQYYGEEIEVHRENLADGDGSEVKFTIVRNS